MPRPIRQESRDWRRLVAESWDGRGSWGNGAAMRVAPPRLSATAATSPRPDTVPFCLWIAAKHPGDFVSAFWDTVCVGDDIDTTCAIFGAILDARLGIEGIPAHWRERCEPLPDWARDKEHV